MMSSTQQTQITNSASGQTSLSFDDISKFFSLPISDAADNLRVCTSVLKKICQENGLVRWPYRKFLSGKSIEEIKRDASQERNRDLTELSKAAGERNDALASSTLSSPSGSQLPNKTSLSTQDASKLRSITTQQQGNKSVQTKTPHSLHSSNMSKGTLANYDEFKYGFPSDGLSVAVSSKWWGSSSCEANKGICGNGAKEMGDYHSQVLFVNTENLESGTKSNIYPQGPALLSAGRKRAVEEGREALKLGVYHSYGMQKRSKREKALLLRIFESSLPDRWRREFSET